MLRWNKFSHTLATMTQITAGQLFIGLMSGTSLDGIDAALVAFDANHQPFVHHTFFLAYPEKLRSDVLRLQHPSNNELEDTALISNDLVHLYAEAVHQLLKLADKNASAITAIGCHGQTIRHRPELGFTLQIGNPALLAELTGITVVSDFRSRDIAAGGQGAPLVPAFHQAVFHDNHLNRAVINIGGIANITYLPSNGQVYGFDSGPGNMLIDAWIKKHLQRNYDANGDWAKTGSIIEPLLQTMMSDPYFKLTPPKSTGRDLFNDDWLNEHLKGHVYAPHDVARTLTALTAYSIYDALQMYCRDVHEVYLCGGGAKNPVLVNDLKQRLSSITLTNTDALGVGSDWVEAIAFAWLAQQCLQKIPASLPSVTGASNARILGAVYQA